MEHVKQKAADDNQVFSEVPRYQQPIASFDVVEVEAAPA